MEALITSLSEQLVFTITHASDVAAARRAGQRLADALGFDAVRAGQLAIIVTEAGTNILKHAGEGSIYIRSAHSTAGSGIDVLAVDNGPGIADFGNSQRDGVSTTGTAGTGLGALQRLSDVFDVYSARGKGAAFFMRLWREPPGPGRCGIEAGAITVPFPGEVECGDGWAVSCDPGGATMLAADGLGHGPEAARASAAAIGALARRAGVEPGELLHAAHQDLRITRGAAMAAARMDFADGQLRFAGIGNIGAVVFEGDGRRALVSHNGIVGHNMRKVQEFSVPCPPGAVCIMYSDGIQTQWGLESYPGLLARCPALIAAVLTRDFIRGRDDAMVLVVRREGGSA